MAGRVRWYHYIGALIGSPIYLLFAYFVVVWRLSPYICAVVAIVALALGEWIVAGCAVLYFFVWWLYDWMARAMSGPEVGEVEAEAMRQEQMARWRRPKRLQLPPR